MRLRSGLCALAYPSTEGVPATPSGTQAAGRCRHPDMPAGQVGHPAEAVRPRRGTGRPGDGAAASGRGEGTPMHRGGPVDRAGAG